METITTSAHVGSDAVLRLEVPLAESDVDVNVILVIESLKHDGQNISGKAEIRARLDSLAGHDEPTIQLPSPGSWNLRPAEVLEPKSSGPSASEMLVSERR